MISAGWAVVLCVAVVGALMVVAALNGGSKRKAVTVGEREFGSVVRPIRPSIAAMERQVQVLHEIGASPRSIQIAEQVLAEEKARQSIQATQHYSLCGASLKSLPAYRYLNDRTERWETSLPWYRRAWLRIRRFVRSTEAPW